MMWKISFTCGHLKKYKKMPNQRHVLHFAELDGGGGYSRKKNLRGRKLNRKFLREKI